MEVQGSLSAQLRKALVLCAVRPQAQKGHTQGDGHHSSGRKGRGRPPLHDQHGRPIEKVRSSYLEQYICAPSLITAWADSCLATSAPSSTAPCAPRAPCCRLRRTGRLS